MTQAERNLLARYIEGGDAEAFREIVTLHQNMVYAACLRVLHNPADAEDAAQNCFLTLARKPHQVKETLGGWLHRVAVHTSLNMAVQNKARRAREAKAVACNSSSNPASWAEISGAVDKCIDQLPDDLRITVIRYYLEGQKQERLAEELGLTQAAVSKRLQRGTESLREALRKGGWMGTVALLAGFLGSRTVEAAPQTLVAALGKMAIATPAVAGMAPTGASAGAGANILSGSAIGGLSSMSKAGITAAAVVILTGAGIVVVNLGGGGKEAKAPSPLAVVSDEPAVNKPMPLSAAVAVTTTVPEHAAVPPTVSAFSPKSGRLFWITFGMSNKEVVMLMGEPDAIVDSGMTLAYTNRGCSVTIHPRRGVISFTCAAKKAMPPTMKWRDFQGRSEENVGIGASEADIIAAYGEPSERRIVDRQVDLTYERPRMRLLLLDNQLASITVHASRP